MKNPTEICIGPLRPTQDEAICAKHYLGEKHKRMQDNGSDYHVMEGNTQL